MLSNTFCSYCLFDNIIHAVSVQIMDLLGVHGLLVVSIKGKEGRV